MLPQIIEIRRAIVALHFLELERDHERFDVDPGIAHPFADVAGALVQLAALRIDRLHPGGALANDRGASLHVVLRAGALCLVRRLAVDSGGALVARAAALALL